MALRAPLDDRWELTDLAICGSGAFAGADGIACLLPGAVAACQSFPDAFLPIAGPGNAVPAADARATGSVTNSDSMLVQTRERYMASPVLDVDTAVHSLHTAASVEYGSHSSTTTGSTASRFLHATSRDDGGRPVGGGDDHRVVRLPLRADAVHLASYRKLVQVGTATDIPKWFLRPAATVDGVVRLKYLSSPCRRVLLRGLVSSV